MIRRTLLSLAFVCYVLLGVAPTPVAAQLSLPAHTFSPGQTISSAQFTALFTAINARALHREGGTMLGELAFSPDNTHDIGASATGRPRDVFVGRHLTIGGTLTIGTLDCSQCVLTASIANFAVTGAKLGDNAVTTSKINNLAVTNAKIDSVAEGKVTGASVLARLASTQTFTGAKTFAGQGTSTPLISRSGGAVLILDDPGAPKQWFLFGTNSNFVIGQDGTGSSDRRLQFFDDGGITMGFPASNTDPGAGTVSVTGDIVATSFSGDGAGITGLAGSYPNITGVGTLGAGSISSGFGNINIGSSTFTGNGSGLSSLNASNLSSGTVPSARMSGTYTNISGIGTISSGSISSGFGNINIGSSTFTGGNLTLSGRASTGATSLATPGFNFAQVGGAGSGTGVHFDVATGFLEFVTNGAPRLSMRAGEMFIGTSRVGVSPLPTGSGNAMFRDGSNDWVVQASSRRYKQNEVAAELDGALLDQIVPTTFEYKSNPQLRLLGFIAEDVAPVLPYAVHYDAEGRPDGVLDRALIAYLVTEVQNLRARVAELEAR